VSISVLVVGASAMPGSTVKGGLNLGKSVVTMSNCHSGNCTGLHHDRSNMVLDSNWCDGDGDLLAHLAGHLLSHGGANLASNLVALLHWGHHCSLHWHRDTLLDTPGVAHIVDHHISDRGAGGPWDRVADSPGNLPWRQVAHWLRHGHTLLGGGALGHCHTLGHIDALGDGDAVGDGNAVGHGDALGNAGALGDSDTVRDSNAFGDRGALGDIDTDWSLNGAGGLDRDGPALPPGDGLADRGGDVVSNSNGCSSNSNWSNSMGNSNWSSSSNNRSNWSSSNSNRSSSSNRCNSMAEGNWANSSSNWADSTNSVASRDSSVVSRGEALGISISLSIGLTLHEAGSSNGTKEWSSSRVSQNIGGGSNMCFRAHLINHIDALLSEGGVDHSGDLGGALLLLHANLLVMALLGGGALLLSHTLGLVVALLVLGALLFSGALLLGGALLFLGALLLHVALLNRGALLLWHLSALLLLDGVHDVAALLLSVGGALLPGNLPGHGLALLHGSAAALLLVLRLVVGHTLGGADGLGDCGAGRAGDGVVDSVALWCDGDCVVCNSNCWGVVSYSNCGGVVSYSNVAVAVGMASPSVVAIGTVSIPGVGFGICFSLSKGKWRHSGKEKNKLLHDYCIGRLATARC